MKALYSVDLGGTNIRVAIINEKFEMVSYFKENTIHNDNDLLLNQIKNLLLKLDKKEYELISICLGVPGKVRNGSIIDDLPNLGIKKLPLKDFLEKEFKLPVHIINDADAANLAEAKIGKSKGFERAFFITISTGLGASLSVKNKISSACKEMGHILTFYKDEYREYERLVSGTGIVNLCHINGLEIKNSREFFDRIKNNDNLALKIYEDWFMLLNRFIGFIKEQFQPEIITFTGGVMNAKDIFFDRLKNENKDIILTECGLKEDAGIYGPAFLIF